MHELSTNASQAYGGGAAQPDYMKSLLKKGIQIGKGVSLQNDSALFNKNSGQRQ